MDSAVLDDSNDRNNLKNYSKVSVDIFKSIYKKLGNIDGKLKIDERGEEVKYYVWTKFLINQ